jgi:hypothetical protein
VGQINSSSIKVSWEPPAAAEGVEIFGYYVYKDKLVNGRPDGANLQKAVAMLDKDVKLNRKKSSHKLK